MSTIALLFAFLATPTAPEGPTTKDAARALSALDKVHAADVAMEKACVKAWAAMDDLPAKPLPHLSLEINHEIKRYRAWVPQACPVK